MGTIRSSTVIVGVICLLMGTLISTCGRQTVQTCGDCRYGRYCQKEIAHNRWPPENRQPDGRQLVLSVSPHDGDSGNLVVGLGFGVSLEIGYRLVGLDTPELTGSSAVAGKQIGRLMVEKSGSICSMRAERKDRYGRWLVELYDEEGVSINSWLLSERLALPYDGGRREGLWSDETLSRAADRAASLLSKPSREGEP